MYLLCEVLEMFNKGGEKKEESTGSKAGSCCSKDWKITGVSTLMENLLDGLKEMNFHF